MTSPSDARLEILANPEVLARRVADWLLAAATAQNRVAKILVRHGFEQYRPGKKGQPRTPRYRRDAVIGRPPERSGSRKIF